MGKYLLRVTSKRAQNLTRRPIKEYCIGINTPSGNNVLLIHDKNHQVKEDIKNLLQILTTKVETRRDSRKKNYINTQIKNSAFSNKGLASRFKHKLRPSLTWEWTPSRTK